MPATGHDKKNIVRTSRFNIFCRILRGISSPKIVQAMLNEEVRKIMSKNPPVAHPDDLIETVANMMVERQYQQLPVVEDGLLVGMITAYDLWRDSRVSRDSENKKVRDVMTTRVIKITPKDKVGTAAELFLDRRFKSLPVVNLRNELKGIITAFDVIRHVLTREYPHPVLYSEVFDELEPKEPMPQ